MRILYFAFVELDIPNACQTHTLGVLSGFCRNGCKVDAIIPHSKKVKPNIPGTEIFYIWPWRFSKLGKFWAKCLGGIYLFLLCLLKKYDAIYVRELELNPLPRWCAQIFKLPYYLEINGLLLLNAKAKNKNYKYLRKIERCQKLDYKKAACLIVPSFPRSHWIIEHYNLESDKVFTVLNGTDIPQTKKLSRSISLKNLHLPVDGFFLGFLGSVWNSYDLKSVIYAMRLCKTTIPDLYLIIIGGGSEVPYLKEVAKDEGL